MSSITVASCTTDNCLLVLKDASGNIIRSMALTYAEMREEDDGSVTLSNPIGRFVMSSADLTACSLTASSIQALIEAC